MPSPMGMFEHQSSIGNGNNLSLRRSHSHLLLTRHQLRKPVIEQDEVDSYRSTSFESSDIDLTPVVENRKELIVDMNADSTSDNVSILSHNVLSDTYRNDQDQGVINLEEEKVEDQEEHDLSIHRIGASSSSIMLQDEPYIFEERFHSECARNHNQKHLLEEDVLQHFAELPFYVNDSLRISNCPKNHGLVEFATYKLVGANNSKHWTIN
jgi:hypothetical protein